MSRRSLASCRKWNSRQTPEMKRQMAAYNEATRKVPNRKKSKSSSSKSLPFGTVCKHPCPECGSRMILRPSKYGLFYGCEMFPRCRSAHGAHADGRPLGVPANAATKRARIAAHDAFDELWKSGAMRRPDAYRWMQEALGLTPDEAHIGMFDEAACKRLVEAVASWEKPPQAKPTPIHNVSKSPLVRTLGAHTGTIPPWPDGWGSPENHETGCDAPFDVDDELSREFREIVGVA